MNQYELIIREGCLLDALDNGEVDAIAHVCNNKGVMGSGFAKQVKQRHPDVYKAYRSAYEKEGLRLGAVEPLFGKVKNLIAQDDYGSGKRFLHYGALVKSLTVVLEGLSEGYDVKTLGIPYKMGSDRAGGDWQIVSEIINGLSAYYGVQVIAYKID